MIKRTNLHVGNPVVSAPEIHQIRYGMAMWLLQEKAGLSYKEARVHLAGSRGENSEQLSQSLDVDLQTIYGLRLSGKKKLKGVDLDDLYMGYYPMFPEVSAPVREPFF